MSYPPLPLEEIVTFLMLKHAIEKQEESIVISIKKKTIQWKNKECPYSPIEKQGRSSSYYE